MAKLTLDEQIEVLSYGKNLLEKWTGQPIIAHRSGGYSINNDTITALKYLDIPIDSSMHATHAHSKIHWSTNQVIEREGVIEIPITQMNYALTLPNIFSGSNLYQKRMQTAMDSCSNDELFQYIDFAQENGLSILNLFMHSYYFLKTDMTWKKIRYNRHRENKIIEFFDALSKRSDIRFMSCSEFLEAYKSDPTQFSGADMIPTVSANLSIARLATAKIYRKIKEPFTFYLTNRSINRYSAVKTLSHQAKNTGL
ncbi:hypothetical protein OLMES_1657 [Oleiphilus messinensis]|uniref:Uncharacterized protein n=2 Tax=Oleiphilus messinensis TaxID=141451 RepID=A0A1Y0I5H6_9GAMM|nr:hypothetical protein OLMES_1657 [Oleiphilus messinensis]